jgi:DNA repair ATPase RecN
MCHVCGQRYDNDTTTHDCLGSIDDRMSALVRRIAEDINKLELRVDALDRAIEEKLAAILEFDKRIALGIADLDRRHDRDIREVENWLRSLERKIQQFNDSLPGPP